MADRSADPFLFLDQLKTRIGAERAVLATFDGLLVAGAGGDRDQQDELAAYAPSSLPAKVARPSGMTVRRVEVMGERFYLASLGAPAPKEAASELEALLG